MLLTLQIRPWRGWTSTCVHRRGNFCKVLACMRIAADMRQCRLWLSGRCRHDTRIHTQGAQSAGHFAARALCRGTNCCCWHSRCVGSRHISTRSCSGGYSKFTSCITSCISISVPSMKLSVTSRIVADRLYKVLSHGDTCQLTASISPGELHCLIIGHCILQ